MTDYTLVILLTLFGFLALAAILLVPVYRFLKKEERSNKNHLSGDGSAAPSQNGKTRERA